jgi:transcriptional regulator with XRE-family HTH domain
MACLSWSKFSSFPQEDGVPYVPVKHALRKVRERLGMTVADLADKSGVSEKMIHKYESREPPSFVRADNAALIADALGLNLRVYDTWASRDKWIEWLSHRGSDDVSSSEPHVHQVTTLARYAKLEKDLGLHAVTLQTSAGPGDLLGQYRQHKVFNVPKFYEKHVFVVVGKVDALQTLNSSAAKKIGAAPDDGAVFRVSRNVAKKLPQYVSVFTRDAETTKRMMQAYDDGEWMMALVHVHYDPPAGPWRGFFFIEAEGQRSKKFCFVVDQIVTEATVVAA